MMESKDNKKNKSETRRSKLVLIEMDCNKNLHVILFRNKKWNKFVTLGGRVDKPNDTFEMALIREVREESFNLIDISDIINIPDRMNYIDFQDVHNNELVRVYFLLINSELFSDKLYKTNRCILNNATKSVPKSWMEVDDYDVFPIKNVLKCANGRSKEHFHCCNVRSESKPIYSPVFKYVREAYKRNLINDQLIVKEYTFVNDNSDTFLNGTTTIKIKN